MKLPRDDNILFEIGPVNQNLRNVTERGQGLMLISVN